MKSLKLHLLVTMCALVSLTSPAWATNSLTFGQTVSGTISTAAQTIRYTMAANAGDIVNLNMVTTSGSLQPDVKLYDSTGTLIAEGRNYWNGTCHNGPTDEDGTPMVEMNSQTLSEGGNYVVVVGDCHSSNTGTYDLYVQRLNNPSGAVSLAFDVPQSNTVGLSAQNNTYTFSASANDVVVLVATATSGGLKPKVRLYDPTATLIDEAVNYANGSCKSGPTDEDGTPTVGFDTGALSLSGAYTVLVGDCDDINTGAYELYVQKTNNPSGAAPIAFGQTQSGTITSAAQGASYTFSASANDVVDITALTTSGSMQAVIQLFDPTGALVSTAENYWNGACHQGPTDEDGTPVVTLSSALSLSGTYTVQVSDCNNSNTGNFDLYLQRINNPGGAASLVYGATVANTIGAQAQSNTYTFIASANDVIDMSMTWTSGGIKPKIRLYDPTGALIATAENYWNGACHTGYTDEDGTPAVWMNTGALALSGAYTVLAGDCDDSNLGNYDLFIQRANNPGGAESLVFGETISDQIDMTAQENTYTFSAAANDSVTFTATLTGSPNYLYPYLELWSPTGAVLSTAQNFYNGSCHREGSVSMGSVTLSTAGTYALFVGDCDAYNTGTYNLSSQCFGTCPLPAPTLTSLSQTSVLAGGGDLFLTVNGTNFAEAYANSVVEWNGNALATTWVSLTQMTAVVPAADTAMAGIFLVTVSTPAPGGGTSAAINFTVNNPVPVLTSLSSNNAIAGGSAFTLTLNGSAFVKSSQVQWNGSSLAIVSQSATQLQATVPAADIATAGTPSVTVFNPTPGGGTSAPQTFTINNPVPATTSLSPASIAFGGPAFTLTINGSKFVSGSVVNWNGSSLAIVSQSATQLQATVTAADIAAAGTASVTVVNLTPGGGTSNAQTFTINKKSPPVTWIAPAAITYGTPLSGTQLDASSTIGGAWVYSPVAGTVLSGGSQTLTATFTPTDTTDYKTFFVSVKLTVNPASQTINFPAIATQVAFTNVNLSATASSGLAVSFSSLTPSVCTVSASTASLIAGGTCTIQAAQAGNADYSAAPAVPQSFTVNPAAQTITFPTITAAQYALTSLPLSASASSGLAVSFTSSTPTICTVSGTTASLLASGTCVLHAAQAGNSNYTAAATVLQGFYVHPALQTITFSTITGAWYALSQITLSATASSGLTVSFASTTPTVCTVSGNTASLLIAGSCILKATQAGSSLYAAATPVTQVVVVHLAHQSITVTPVNGTQYALTQLTMTASSSSGLPVTLASATPSVCTLTGNTLSLLIAGTCDIHATQAGNATYAIAPLIAYGIDVHPILQTITFPTITGTNYPLTKITLTATATSGLTVSFASITPAVCTVSGKTASLLTGGNCILHALQTGTPDYAAAPIVTQQVYVTPLSQTITWPAITGTQYAASQLTLTATASSGLTAAFVSTTPAVCTVAGATASLLASGTCILQATQAGNSIYAAAPVVQQSVVVHLATQTITFPTIASQMVGANVTLSATASSGLTVAFTSATGSVCTVSGTTATMVATGSCVLHATQAGNTTYAAAPLVSQSITVKAAS